MGVELNFLSSSHIDIPCGACKIFYETRYKCTLAPRLADVGHVSEEKKVAKEAVFGGGRLALGYNGCRSVSAFCRKII